MKNFNKVCISLLLIALPSIFSFNSINGQAYIKSSGIPFIENYTRQEFDGGTQSWSVTQDQRGVMYFGNNNGVLEFDGTNWRRLQMGNGSIVRTVYSSSDGRVYVGAFNEFGYLTANKQGDLKFFSLTGNMSAEDKEFGEVWSIQDTPRGILFQSFSHTFLYNGSIEPILKDRNLNYAYSIDSVVFIGDIEKGLLSLNDTSVNPIEGGDIFSGKTITGISTLNSLAYLIGTSYHGFYIYKDKEFTSWNTEISQFIKRNQLYDLKKINKNLYAAGTIKDGIAFFDASGKIIQHLNKKTGMQNNSVLGLYLDSFEDLWVALDNGIDLIKLSSPVSMLVNPGEYGTGYVARRKDDMIYFGTNHGLYYAPVNEVLNTRTQVSIQSIPETNGQVWNLQEFDDLLLCGHHNGVYQVVGKEVVQISDILGNWKFVRSARDSSILIASTYTGLSIYKIDKSRTPAISLVKKLEGFDESCREMESDESGTLWLTHAYKGIYRIKLTEDNEIKDVKYYNINDGLPFSYFNTVTKIGKQVYVLTRDGIYNYNQRNDSFEKNTHLSALLGDDKINKIIEDNYGDIWYFQNNELGLLRSNFTGSYLAEKVPFIELKGVFVQYYESAMSIDPSTMIFSTEYGFILFDKENAGPGSNHFSVLIRDVSNIDDQTLFMGNFIDQEGKFVLNRPEDQEISIPHNQNTIKFSVSSLLYSNSRKSEYSYWLEGHEKVWSDWTRDISKKYSRLSGGNYTFHVKARNEFHIETEESTFRFFVKKPWYWNIFSIVSYIILLAVIAYTILKIISKRIEKERDILESKRRNQLKEKEKSFEHERLIQEQEIVKLRNENLRIENERGQVELENKSKELASIVMKISSTNEVINMTRFQLQKVIQSMVHEESKTQVSRLIRNLDKELEQQDNWQQFEVHFDKVHENFIKTLRTKFPELTPKDLKMAAYLRMNMSTKEIAQLFNLTMRGVETSRFRLRKKLGISREDNLTDFLMSVYQEDVEN